jgi:LmbE family N-acetylglucosaminyl deacetylase
MTHNRRASLLVVLAHPDDEIFHGGVLAHLSERGVRVTLVCATDTTRPVRNASGTTIRMCWSMWTCSTSKRRFEGSLPT